ncbi:hypothetical protein FB451DRAFT_1391983 [Mycena latifolia]|nr:hypothetical protein FB451DRAFT_1391983 [Mycena latifolia]
MTHVPSLLLRASFHPSIPAPPSAPASTPRLHAGVRPACTARGEHVPARRGARGRAFLPPLVVVAPPRAETQIQPRTPFSAPIPARHSRYDSRKSPRCAVAPRTCAMTPLIPPRTRLSTSPTPPVPHRLVGTTLPRDGDVLGSPPAAAACNSSSRLPASVRQAEAPDPTVPSHPKHAGARRTRPLSDVLSRRTPAVLRAQMGAWLPLLVSPPLPDPPAATLPPFAFAFAGLYGLVLDQHCHFRMILISNRYGVAATPRPPFGGIFVIGFHSCAT